MPANKNNSSSRNNALSTLWGKFSAKNKISSVFSPSKGKAAQNIKPHTQTAHSSQSKNAENELKNFISSLEDTSISSATIRNYRSDIKQFLSFTNENEIDKAITDDNIAQFTDFQRNKGLMASSIKRKLASINQFSSWINHKSENTHIAKTSIPKQNKTERMTHSEASPVTPQTNQHLSNYLLALKASDCSPSTLRNYRSDINQFIEFTGENRIVSLITKPQLDQFALNQSKKGLKRASVMRKLSSITQFGLWAEGLGLVDKIDPEWPSKITDENFEKPSKPTPKPQYYRDNTQVKAYNTPKYPKISPASTTPSRLARLKTKIKQSKKIITNPINPASQVKQSNSSNLLPYLNLAAIMLFISGLGYFAYQQFAGAAPSLAFPNSPTRPNRVLSFQGRLTDTAQNPLTTATDMEYRLYDSLDSGGTNTLLWDSNTCSVTPDQDGIFAANLGAGSGAGADDDNCGAEIADSVFTENSNVWLEVQIVSETLTPRQPIRTVAFALNSETVKGFPVNDNEIATANTLITMNDAGEVVLGETSPVIRSTTGDFTLEGQALLLQTTAGSDGDIVLDADGIGGVISRDYLYAPGATLSATWAGGTALVARGGPGGTGNIQEWQNSSGTFLFGIGPDGHLGIGVDPEENRLVSAENIFNVSSGTVYGVSGQVQNTGTTEVRGLSYQAISSGGGNAQGVVSTARALSGSSPTRLVGVSANIAVESGASPNEGVAFRVLSPTISGSLTTAIGLEVEDITGATNNFAIRTNDGIVSFGDSVGIGTNSPDTELHVVGKTKLVQDGYSATDGWLATDGTNSVNFFLSSGAGSVTLRSTAGDFKLSPSGSEVMRITGSSQRVGIGTASPSEKLDVSGAIRLGTAGVNNVLNTSAAAGAPSGDLYWGDNIICDDTGNCGTSGMPAGTTGQTLRHDGADWVSNSVLYNDGTNVGIGTTSPGAALHISKDGQQLLVEPNSATGQDALVEIRGHRNGATGINQAELLFSNYDNDLTSTNKLGLISGEVTNATTNIGDLIFTNYSNGSTASETMRLTSGGSVGIGTTIPNALLDVAGSVEFNRTGTATVGDFSVSGSNNPTMYFGRLSPTTSDSTDFVFRSRLNQNKLTIDTAGGGDITSYFESGGNGSFVVKRLGGGGETFLQVNESTGNVGIGTTAPSSRLDVETSSGADTNVFSLKDSTTNVDFNFEIGDTGISGINAKNLVIAGSSAASDIALSPSSAYPGLLFLDGSTGNIGIGSTTPAQLLDVQGGTGIVGQFSGRVIGGDAVNNDEFVTKGQLNTLGVTSVTGTANQITSSPTTGDVILSIPSDFRAPGTVNAVSGIYTGAGAGTLRLDASGNLTNIGTLTTNSTVTLNNTAAGTDNTVLVLNGSNQVVTDEIDSRVWGSSLIDGSGTANYVARFSDSDTLTTGVLYDNGTNVGIGTTTPEDKFHVEGNIQRLIGDYTSKTIELPHTNIKENFVLLFEKPTAASGENGAVIQGTFTIHRGATSSSNEDRYGTFLASRGYNAGYNANIAWQSGDRWVASFSEVDYGGNTYIALKFDSSTSGTGIIMDVKYKEVNAGTLDSNFLTAVTEDDVTNEVTNVGSQGIANDFNSNIGIGTTAPTQTLHVQGNARLTGALYDVNNQPGTSNQVLSSTGTGVDWIDASTFGYQSWTAGDSDGTTYDIVDSNILRFTSSDSNIVTNLLNGDDGDENLDFTIRMLSDAVAGSGLSGGADDVLVGADTDVTFDINAGDGIALVTDSVTVDEAFNFAWTGTHSWSNTADFNGNVSIADTDVIFDGASTNFTTTGDFSINTSQFFVDQSSGNVGIGTTNPSQKFHVNNGNLLVQSGSIGSNDSGLNHIIKPEGAAFNGSGTQTGAIKISLPVSWSTDMMRMTVDIYDYANDESFTVMLGGYNYSGSNNWIRTFAQIIAGKTDRDFAVRFGHDGTTNAIWIGETTSTWGYPKIAVTNFQSNGTYSELDDGWDITMDTDFTGDTISATEVNNLVSPWIADGNDRYSINSGNIGIGSTSPNEKLDVVGNIQFSGSLEPGGLPGSVGEVLVSQGAGVAPIWSASVPASSLAWDDLTDPDANLSLGMGTNTTDFNWATGTGANNLFNFTTDASANGTGSLLNIQTGTSSTVDPLRVRAGATEALMVNDSGNVGIGTTNPSGYKLFLTGGRALFENNSNATETTALIARNNGSSPGTLTSLEFWGSDGIPMSELVSGRTASSGNDGYLQFRTRKAGVSNTVMTVNEDGNLGIGTTSPSYQLETIDDVRLASSDFTVSDGRGFLFTEDNFYHFYGSGTGIESNPRFGYDRSINPGGGVSGSIIFNQGGGQTVAATGTAINQPATRTLAFSTSNGSSLTERMRIDGEGNVGIGTTSPGASLDIGGDIHIYDSGSVSYLESINNPLYVQSAQDLRLFAEQSSSNDVYVGSGSTGFIKFRRGATDTMTIDTTGNVGIGTTVPGALLDVAGSVEFNRTGTATAGDFSVSGSNNPTMYFGRLSPTTSDSTDFVFRSRLNQNKLTIDTAGGGDVTSYFESGGGGSFVVKRLGGDNATFLQVNESTGNVGIGSTTPSQKLDVLGSIRLGTAGAGNVLGTSAAAAPTGDLFWGSRTICDDTGNCGTAGLPSGTTGQTLRHNGSDWVANSVLFNNGTNVGIGTTTLNSKLNVDGDIELTTNGQFEKVMNSNMAVIEYPEGGYYQTTANTVTGAIEITLPVMGPTDMMKMTVDVYDYSTDESVTLIISGYNYSTTNWNNTSVQILGSETDKAYTVRYGHDGVNSKIWIGELASTWNYPQVIVREVMLGFQSQLSDWQGAWDIDFESTAFNTVVQTQSGSGNFPQASNADTVDDISSGSFLRSDTTDSYTSGTLTFSGGTTADINGDLSIADTDVTLDGATANINSSGNFSINTDNLFVLKSNGNVGIGTTVPDQALEVDGSISLNNSDTNDIKFANYNIGQTGATEFNISDVGTGGNEFRIIGDGANYANTQVRIGTNVSLNSNGNTYFNGGNVGIGDASPASLFSVGSGNLFQVNSSGNIVQLGGFAHSIVGNDGINDLLIASAASSDIKLDAATDLLFSDDNATNIPLTVADSTLNANLGQGVIDAINDVYDAATGGSGGIWTDTTPGAANGIVYSSELTDDFAIGATSTAAPFSVDVSQQIIRMGSGSGNNARLDMYASDGDTGRLEYTTEDGWDFSGGSVAIGEDASVTANTALVLDTHHNVDTNTYQLYSATTQTSPTLTGDRTSYGQYLTLTNNKTEDTGNGYDSDAYGAYLRTITSGTNTWRNNYGLYGLAETTSTATSNQGSLYGVRGRAYVNTTAAATIPSAYGLYGSVQGDTNLSASSITSAYGTYSQIYAYNTDITNAYGQFNRVRTMNGYDGDITNAYGSYNEVNDQSDDGGDITTGTAGYFVTAKAASAPLMQTSYGIHVNANSGTTTYGGRFVVDDTAPTTNYGISLDVSGATANNYGLYGVNGDWVLRADGDGISGGTGAGGDLVLGAGQDLELYHDGTDSFIVNNTGNLQINGNAANGVVFNEPGVDVDFRVESDNDANALFIQGSSGNVGIGSTAPAYKLDVVSGDAIAASFDGRVIGSDAVNNDEFVTLSQLSGGVGSYWTRTGTNLLPTTAGDDLYLGSGEVLGVNYDPSTITGGVAAFNGNVGIGATNPLSTLQVNSNTTTFGNNLRLFNTDNTIGAGPSILFHADATTTQQMAKGGIAYARTANYGRGDMHFLQNTDSAYGDADISDSVMVIQNDGNVGIGTTSPENKLEVAGNIRLPNSGKIYLWKDHDSNFIDYNTWNINTSAEVEIKNSGTGDISIETASLANILLQPSGNVGIGTTAPSQKLSVQGGGITTDEFYAINNGADVRSVEWSEDIGSSGVITDGVTYLELGGSDYPFLGNLEITITGGYNTGQAFGEVKKVVSFYHPSGGASLTSLNEDVLVAHGKTATALAIGTPEIDGSNNVRIPIYKLSDTDNISVAVNVRAISRGGNLQDMIDDFNLTSWATVANSETRNHVSFSDSNVGIGTYDPAYSLDTTGSVRAQDSIYVGSTGANFFSDASNRVATTSNFYIQGASATTHLYSANTYLGGSSGDNIRFRSNEVFGDNWRISSTNGSLHTGSASEYDYNRFGSGGTADFAIDGASDVYIEDELEVDGSICLNNVCESNWGDIGHWTLSGTDLYPDSTTYDVGIGTTSPEAKLEVNETSTGITSILGRGSDANFELNTYQDKSSNSTGAVIGGLGLNYNANDNASIRFHRGSGTTGGFISFTTDDESERLRIDTNGNVGINDTTPDHTLDLDGDFMIDTDTGGQKFNISRLGAVTQNLSIYTDDANAVFTSEQDEITGNLGGFTFRMDDDNANLDPYFSIRGKATNDVFRVRTQGTNNYFYGKRFVSMTNPGTPGENFFIQPNGSESIMVNGKASIGNATPGFTASEKLNVGGAIFSTGTGPDLRAYTSASEFTRLHHSGVGGNSYIDFAGGDLFIRDEANTKLFIEDSTGDIGINNTNPGAKLDVTGTGRFSSTLTLNGVAAGTDNTVLVLNGSNQVIQDEIDSRVWGSTLVDGSGTLNYLSKWSPDTNSLANSIIYDNGTNVGIGFNSPGYKLDVDGINTEININSDGYIQDISGRLARNLVSSHSWSVGTGSNGIFSQNGDTSENSREWGVGPHGNNAILWKATNDATSNADGGWNTSYIPTDHEKMYRFTQWIKKTNSNSGTTYFGTLGGGNAVTTLAGAASGNPYFFSADLPSLNKWYLVVGYVHASNDSSTTSYGGVYDGVTGEKMSSTTDFKSSNTTTSLRHRSYLYNDTNTSDRQYWWDPRMEEVNGHEPTIESLIGVQRGATKGDDAYFGGNVGIGTASPTQRLDVNGIIAIDGVETIYNASALGDSSGSLIIGGGGGSISSTGNHNTFFGIVAGQDITTGDYNTGTGSYALGNVNTGYNNTAQGYFSLSNLQGGYNNSANGVLAMSYLSSGYQNSTSGVYSLRDVTSGYNNTVLGYDSGRGITTGHDNTIIGANVTGLSSSLANHIIIADGDGVIKIKANAAGDIELGDGSSKTTLLRQSGTTEGGELIFQGGTSYGNSHYLDRYANDLRLIYNGNARMRITGAGKMYLDDTSIGSPADIAERFDYTEDIDLGDIITVDSAASELALKKTSNVNDVPFGIISTKAGFILGDESVEEYYTNEDGETLPGGLVEDKRPAVALAGRVPIKINLEGGPIQIGDPLMVSSSTGIAMKANRPGMTVAIALETYDGSIQKSAEVQKIEDTLTGDDTLPKPIDAGVGKIMSFVNIAQHNPSLFIDKDSSFSISKTDGEYSIAPSGYTSPLTQVSSFAKLVTANIESGLITTQELIVNTTATIQDLTVNGTATISDLTTNNLSANSITISGQSLSSYITSVVSSMNFADQTTVTQLDTDVTQLETDTTNNTTQIAINDTDIAQITTDIATTSAEITDLTTDTATLAAQLDTQEASISSALAKLNAQKDSLTTDHLGVGTAAPATGSGKVIDTNTGAYLSEGGVWTNVSDVNKKENFTEVDSQSILDKIANLDITRWNYKVQDSSITHIGPMAQDFYAAFGLGEFATNISSLDPASIALSGVQALNDNVNSLEDSFQALGEELNTLKDDITTLAGNLTNTNNNLDTLATNTADLEANLEENINTINEQINNLQKTDTETQIKLDSQAELSNITDQNSTISVQSDGSTRLQQLIAEDASISGETTLGDLIVTNNAEVNQNLTVDQNLHVAKDATISGTTRLGELVADTGEIKQLNADTITTSDLSALNLETGTTTTTTLEATTITAQDSRLEYLESKVATLEKVDIQTANIVNATVSGTLYANNIDGFDERVAEAFNQTSLLGSLLGQDEDYDPFTDLDLSASLGNNNDLGSSTNFGLGIGSTATSSAQLNMTLADLNLGDNEIVIAPSAAFINKYLEVNGSGYIGGSLGVQHDLVVDNSLSVGNSLAVGGSMAVGGSVSIDDSITVAHNAIIGDSLNVGNSLMVGNTYFSNNQISLMSGLMTITDDGRVTIDGNLRVAGALDIQGELRAKDTLLANLIKPEDIEKAVQLQLSEKDPITGDVNESRFEIVDELGTPVATISADGAAEFTRLRASGDIDLAGDLKVSKGINIDSETIPEATESGDLTTTKTAGKAKLPAGSMQVIIKSLDISDETLIYITPIGSTRNQVIYIAEQVAEDPDTIAKEGHFTVAIDTPLAQDIEFNWWMVN